MSRLTDFIGDESGAITVDWVVITAAVIALCIGLMAAIGATTNRVTADTTTEMGTASAISDLADGS